MAFIEQLGNGLRRFLPSRPDRAGGTSFFTTGDGLLSVLRSVSSPRYLRDSTMPASLHTRANDRSTVFERTEALHADSGVAWQWRGEQDIPIAQITALRYQIASVLQDCQCDSRDKVMLRIRVARAPIDLWLLRIDVFGVISQSHGQTEARERINGLLPYFRDLLPPRLLMPI